MRRSKSAMDLRQGGMGTMAKAGTKRFQPAMENIPSKRLKIATKTIARPQLNIKTQEKKNAILSTIKSSNITSSIVSKATAALKKPLIKSSSAGASISTAKVKPASTTAKSAVTTASKNIAKNRIPPYDFKARFHDLKERYDTLKSKSDQQKVIY